MARSVISILCFGSLLIAGSAGANISVMTRNLYLGADLTPVFAASAEDFPAAAAAALGEVAQNNFRKRASALAGEVARTQPHVIGLQEAFLFSVDGLTPGIPFIDMLEVFEAALAARGLDYVRVSVSENVDLTIPEGAIPGLAAELRVLDRDVILVRGDVAGSAFVLDPLADYGCPFERGDGCRLPSLALPPLLVPFETPDAVSPNADPVVARGFHMVSLRVAGIPYTVANTHLEVRQPSPDPSAPLFQGAQAALMSFLITGYAAANPGERVVLVGDLNSDPSDPDPLPLPPGSDNDIDTPYQTLVAAGFIDAWTRNFLIFFNPDGSTCCQQADLNNFNSQLDERIDHIWVLNRRFGALALVTGERRLFGGRPRWSSDHGGVFGLLLFP